MNCFFFFQAEDGIRDIGVTGVQTCALPIFRRDVPRSAGSLRGGLRGDRARSRAPLLRGTDRGADEDGGPAARARRDLARLPARDRKSTRLNSSHANISYAVFCLKKKKQPLSMRVAHRSVGTDQ